MFFIWKLPKTPRTVKNAPPRIWNHWCKGKCCQGRNEVRWRPGQEASLAPSCSKLRSFGSKFTVLKKVPVTLLELFGVPRSESAPGNCAPLAPLFTPLSVVLLRNHSNVSTPRNVRPCPPCGYAITTNHAERAFPSCVETTRWRRFSKSLWRDVNQLCSLAKAQRSLYVWKISSASKRKYANRKVWNRTNMKEGKCQRLQKMRLEMEVTLWASSLRKRS